MKESTRQKAVYALAGAGILMALYIQFGISVKKPASPPLPAQVAVSIDPAAGLENGVAQSIQENKKVILAQASNGHELLSGWGIDPFGAHSNRLKRASSLSPSSIKGAEAKSASWQLGGIIYLPNNPVAYINDESVHVGQDIDGATVSEITPKFVRLMYRGERVTLTLGKG